MSLIPHLLNRSRRAVAMLAATALLALAAVPATTAPARAQDADDLIRFLLGAVAVAVIVRAIDDSQRPAYLGDRILPEACLETVHLQGRNADIYNSRCLRRAGYRNLPDRCEVRYRTANGRREGYESRCMYRAGYRPETQLAPQRPGRDRLPARCEMTYRLGATRAVGYDALCLRGAGFSGLPRRCERTTRGGDILFDGQCLWDAGYRRGR